LKHGVYGTYEDFTETETARLLGIAVGTVKSHARDALVTLQSQLPEAADLLH
jgi:DNA-directed RNA polymerase specialized sigma24 family protein